MFTSLVKGGGGALHGIVREHHVIRALSGPRPATIVASFLPSTSTGLSIRGFTHYCQALQTGVAHAAILVAKIKKAAIPFNQGYKLKSGRAAPSSTCMAHHSRPHPVQQPDAHSREQCARRKTHRCCQRRGRTATAPTVSSHLLGSGYLPATTPICGHTVCSMTRVPMGFKSTAV